MGRRKLPPPGSFARAQLDQRRDQPVADYVLDRLPPERQRGAIEQAIQAAAEHFGVDRTTVQRSLKRHRAAAALRGMERWAQQRLAPASRLDRAMEPGRRLEQALELISSYVTAAELKELAAVSLATIVRIARDRQRAERVPQDAPKISGRK